jgi:hypothetical protein
MAYLGIDLSKLSRTFQEFRTWRVGFAKFRPALIDRVIADLERMSRLDEVINVAETKLKRQARRATKAAIKQAKTPNKRARPGKNEFEDEDFIIDTDVIHGTTQRMKVLRALF